MKKKAMLFGASLLVVLGMILGSCAKQSPATTALPASTTTTALATTAPATTATLATTTQVPAVTVAPTVAKTESGILTPKVNRSTEQPKYGGILSLASLISPSDFDHAYTRAANAFTLDLTHDQLLAGDWASGPSGTNRPENAMASGQFPADQFLRGQVLSSWDYPDPLHMIFHIRPGVYFHNKPPVNGRECTAQDVMFTINRYMQPPANAFVNMAFTKTLTMTTPDKYTLDLKWTEFKAMQFVQITWYPYIIAPESIVTNAEALRDWKNECGTGPYLLTDYVKGSSIYFTKNANYWGKDPLHPNNSLPYIDNIKILIVPDNATLLAMVRSRKVDRVSVSYLDAVSLKQTDPNLKAAASYPSTTSLKPRVDIPPFDDIRVRKAASMAIDRAAILRDYFQGSSGYPGYTILSGGWPETTPFDQLPASTKEIYTYNPQKAKQLLAEAGYPNGISTAILCTQNGSQGAASTADFVAYIKTFWDAVGIKTSISVVDSGAETTLRTNRQFVGVYTAGHGQTTAAATLENNIAYEPYNNANYGNVQDPKYDKMLSDALATYDPVERSKKLKALNDYLMETVWLIPYPAPFAYILWQPWLKGYDGETNLLLSANWALYKYTWIDENLKK